MKNLLTTQKHSTSRRISCCAQLILIGLSLSAAAKNIYFNGSDFKGGYYIVPENLPSDGSKVWVMVDVHGAGGLKKERASSTLSKIVTPEPVIIIIPSFVSGYQGGAGASAKQLISNFKAVQKKYAVHDKMFVHGHSGGGQFAHRFAFNEPKYVIGVSAHSSGSWSTGGNFGSISTRSKSIPFTISCGEKDTKRSVAGYPHTRINWFKLFSSSLKKKGFTLASQTWPNAGHGVSAKLYGPQLKECFLLATQGIEPSSVFWSGDVKKMADTSRKKYGGPSESKNDIKLSYNEIREIEAINKSLSSNKKPDQLTVLRFLSKNPASKWATDAQYSELKAFCKKSAEGYLKSRESEGKPLTGKPLENFKLATEGLEIKQP